MSDLEKRIAALEAWRNRVAPYINRSIPLGPRRPSRADEEEANRQIEAIVKAVADILPVDHDNQQLVSGAPVPKDWSHTELKENGQQKDYIVLSPEERAKGFVRPVRRSYIHAGKIAVDAKEEGREPLRIRAGGCGTETRMSQEIAETYARDPKFYNGTFCCGCGKHFPLDQFVWKDAPDEQVGS